MATAFDEPAGNNPTVAAARSGATGPRTDAGKARSCMNAVTHGLTANTPLLPGEDAEAFRIFVWAIIEDLEPQGPVQAELASRAAVLMWKRGRINRAEQQVFWDLHARYAEEAMDVVEEKEEFAETPGQIAEAAEARREEEANGEERNSRHLLADELAIKPKHLERLARYEQRIHQQIDSTLRLLLKLQNRKDWRRQQEGRRSEPCAAPGRAATDSTRPPAPTPRPPAPAQNELASRTADLTEAQPPRPWTGPPGAN